MMMPLQVRSPHTPPPGSSILESILWILTHPQSWWPLMQLYAVEIIIAALIISVLAIIVNEATKYYLLKEVYCVDPNDRRNRKKIGRQILYVTKTTPFFNQKLPKNKPVKGIMYVRDSPFNNTMKIYIPKDVKVHENHPKRTTVMRANIKHDYQLYKGLIPTNETFEAISPSADVFKGQMEDKIEEADNQVSKSINCNPDVAKHQRTSGSIPLSASNTKRSRNGSRIVESMSSFTSKRTNDESEEEDEDEKKGTSSIEGLEDLKGELNNV